MKKTLLATVAAAALFAGTSLAMAQSATKEQGGAKGGAEMNRGGAAEMHRGGAEMSKGAESKGGAESKSHAQTTGQGVGMDTKADQKAGGKAENKTGEMNRSGQAEQKGPSQRTGQAEQKGGSKSTTGQATTSESKSQAQSKEGPAANKNQAQENRQSPANRNQAQENRNQPANQAAQGRSSTTTGQGAATSTQAGGAVNLTSEQRTTIRQSVIERGGAPKISRSEVNFNIGVGTVVPRTVHVVEVPDTLIRIHPAWRGYRYFVVDEEIIIVEPSTLRIIAVLDV